MQMQKEKRSAHLQFWVTPSLKQRVVKAAQDSGIDRWQTWAETVLTRAAAGDIQL